MKASIHNVAAIIISLQLMYTSSVLADEEKVPESVAQEVAETEKQPPEEEKTEEGEASGNVEDCEQANDAGDSQDSVEKKDLDNCDEMVK